MRQALLPAALIVLVAAGAGASPGPTYTVEGRYLVGDPVAYLLIDACGGLASQEGLDSNCVRLPPGLADKPYVLKARDAAGTLVASSVCFYSDDLLRSACDPADARVPAWAGYASVSSLGGVSVRWTFTA